MQSYQFFLQRIEDTQERLVRLERDNIDVRSELLDLKEIYVKYKMEIETLKMQQQQMQEAA